MLMLSICSRMFCLSVVNFGQWIKKWFNISVSKSQIQIGLSVFKKLCLNLSSLKWLRSKWRRVRKMSPFGWLTLKTLLLHSFIKFKIFFLKIKYEGELPISKSNLFHSINADGKKKNQESYSLLQTGKSPSFDFFLFDMNCYLKELCQINNHVK